jgi:cytoskeletal protein CcmA (bactofilin family)
MWTKRKDEAIPAKPTPPSVPAEPVKEGIPVSPTPTKTYDSDSGRESATIGKSVSIKGQIFSRENLTVDGEVEGSIELHEHRLTVGPNGKVNAGVKAREIIILGTVLGNVEALDKIDIRKDAKLVGDIKTARIVIEDGAYFKGSIDIVRKDTAPTVTAPAAKPQQPAIPTNSSSHPAATPGMAGR